MSLKYSNEKMGISQIRCNCITDMSVGVVIALSRRIQFDLKDV